MLACLISNVLVQMKGRGGLPGIEDGKVLLPEAVAGPQWRKIWSSCDLLVGDTGRTKSSSDIYLLPGFRCSIRMILDLVKVEVKVFNARHVITTDSHLGFSPLNLTVTRRQTCWGL